MLYKSNSFLLTYFILLLLLFIDTYCNIICLCRKQQSTMLMHGWSSHRKLHLFYLIFKVTCLKYLMDLFSRQTRFSRKVYHYVTIKVLLTNANCIRHLSKDFVIFFFFRKLKKYTQHYYSLSFYVNALVSNFLWINIKLINNVYLYLLLFLSNYYLYLYSNLSKNNLLVQQYTY